MPKRHPKQASLAYRLILLERKIDKLAQDHLPPVRKRSRLTRAAEAIRLNGATQFVAALGIWLFVITIGGLVWDYSIRSEERHARLEEAEFRKLAQISSAWETLLRPVGGNTGKGNALNTLLEAEVPLVGADFSCQSVGSWAGGKCISPPIFSGLQLVKGDFWTWEENQWDGLKIWSPRDLELSGVKFDGAVIKDLRAEQFAMGQGLSDVIGSNWIVRGAYQGRDPDKFTNFACKNCTFLESELDWNVVRGMPNFTIAGSNVEVPTTYESEIDGMFEALKARPMFKEVFKNRYPPLVLDTFKTVGRTMIDAPVVFFWTKQEPVVNSNILITTSVEGPVQDRIVWPVYDALTYCANRQDFEELEPHLKQLHMENLPFRSIKNPGEDVQKLYVEEAFEGWRTRYKSVYNVRTLSSMTVLTDPVAPQSYACGFSKEEVWPLLSKRLLKLTSDL